MSASTRGRPGIDGCEKLGFPPESGESFFVFREFLRKHFGRDVATELGVASAVDLTHATFADRLEDLVMRKFVAGQE